MRILKYSSTSEDLFAIAFVGGYKPYVTYLVDTNNYSMIETRYHKDLNTAVTDIRHRTGNQKFMVE